MKNMSCYKNYQTHFYPPILSFDNMNFHKNVLRTYRMEWRSFPNGVNMFHIKVFSHVISYAHFVVGVPLHTSYPCFSGLRLPRVYGRIAFPEIGANA